MTFRKATLTDSNRCLEIYNAVCDWEAANGKQTCWEKGFYPTMETVTNSLANEDLYVLEEEIEGHTVVVACGIINKNQPEYYKNFDWKIQVAGDEVLVLHTFAVDPALQRKGFGIAFMGFYETMAWESGCKTLRLDTIISNQKSQAMYKKLGFEIMGQWEGDPNGVEWILTFLGLEKVLC